MVSNKINTLFKNGTISKRVTLKTSTMEVSSLEEAYTWTIITHVTRILLEMQVGTNLY